MKYYKTLDEEDLPLVQLAIQDLRPIREGLLFQIQSLRAFIASLHTGPVATIEASLSTLTSLPLREGTFPFLGIPEESHAVEGENLRRQLALEGFGVPELKRFKNTISLYISILEQDQPQHPVNLPQSKLGPDDSASNCGRECTEHNSTSSFQKLRLEKWVQEQVAWQETMAQSCDKEGSEASKLNDEAAIAVKSLKPELPVSLDVNSISSKETKVENSGQENGLSRASTLAPDRDAEHSPKQVFPFGKPKVSRRWAKRLFGCFH